MLVNMAIVFKRTNSHLIRLVTVAVIFVMTAKAASLTGTWDVVSIGQNGGKTTSRVIITRKKGGFAVKAVFGSDAIEGRLVSGNDQQISYELPINGRVLSVVITVDGDRLKGTFSSPEGRGGTMAGTRADPGQ